MKRNDTQINVLITILIILATVFVITVYGKKADALTVVGPSGTLTNCSVVNGDTGSPILVCF